MPGPMLNALCVDADELTRNLAEAGYRVRERRYDVARETEAVLEELAALGLRATFFLPGHFLDGGAHLVARIADEGHEIASHGTLHARVETMSPEQFLEDVSRSRKELEDLSGRAVDTYKAPMWSITPRCDWAYDVLLEAGFRIDHSAMPALKQRLGVPEDSHEPFTYSGALLVIPATVASLLGRTLQFPGGFYNAWAPHAFARRTYARINAQGLPFNFYFHPYEHSPAPAQRRWYQHSLPISLYALHAGRYRRMLRRLAREYALGTLREAYARWMPEAG